MSLAASAALLSLALVGTPSLVFSEQGPDDSSAAFWVRLPDGTRRFLASVPASPGYEPYSELAPDQSAIIAVSLAPETRDVDQGASVWRIALPSGSVSLVESGAAYGPAVALPQGGAAWLRVTEVRPAEAGSGRMDTVTTEVRLSRAGSGSIAAAADTAYGLHLAGFDGRRLVIYRVGHEESAFYLADLSPSAGMKRLAKTPAGATARDFSVASGALYFSSPTADGSQQSIWRLSLADGRLESLFGAPADHLAPLATSRGVLCAAPDASGGALSVIESGKPRALMRFKGTPAPLRADSTGRWVAVRVQGPGGQSWGLLDLERRAFFPIESRGFIRPAGFVEAP